MKDKKIKIGLFLGGKSSEKEISLESARHVYNNLDEEKYDKVLLFMDCKLGIYQITERLLWMNTTSDIELNLKTDGKKIFFEDLKNIIDFAFVAMHGKYAEDAMPGLFEILEIPNNCAGVLGGALSMDKYRQRDLLTAVGLHIPKFVSVESSEFKQCQEKILERIEKEIGFPCIVKPSREGSSTAISMPETSKELERAIKKSLEFDNVVLAEEMLRGREVTTAVVGVDEVKVLKPTETPAKGNFLTAQEKFLPGDARMITPPNLPQETIKLIQDSCKKAYEVLSLKIFSRIDGFWTGDKFVILEPNNPPAMTPSTALWHQVAEEDMNAREFLSMIIEIGLEAFKNKRGPL